MSEKRRVRMTPVKVSEYLGRAFPHRKALVKQVEERIVVMLAADARMPRCTSALGFELSIYEDTLSQAIREARRKAESHLVQNADKMGRRARKAAGLDG